MSPSSFRPLVAITIGSLVLLGSGCSAPTGGGNILTGCCAVTGVVKRSTGEPLGGVDVRVAPDGLPPTTGTTTATGTYAVTIYGTTGIVTLSNLPAECTPPPPAAFDVGGGVTTKVNFSLTCTP